MKREVPEAERLKLRSQVGQLPNVPFEPLALAVFRYQVSRLPLFREYLKLVHIDPQNVRDLNAIPFLPIAFFKSHRLKSGDWEAATEFTSSGTTGSQTSRHLVRDPDWYLAHARKGFEFFYGPVREYAFLALLPAYLERSGSSLVTMADHFIRLSRYGESGFFLDQYDALLARLEELKARRIPTVLLGVSFALLDLAEKGPFSFPDLIVMETGGMKGRRKEITRKELHGSLCSGFGVERIHSEYGMTELFSQAYSTGAGMYRPAPTMRVFSREITDPLSPQKAGKTGVLNLMDLANLDTISFLATDDLGRVYSDGRFEVLGRLDHSDVRGCNLLVF
jgi:hypothetical protein